MIIRKRLLLEGRGEGWESRVLNPAAIKEGETTHVFYRAVREPNNSSIGYASVRDGKVKRLPEPVLEPSEPYEMEGIEDPRITKIGKEYHMLYTAWDGSNARVAHAVSSNLRDFEKCGLVSPNVSLGEATSITESERYRGVWNEKLVRNGDSLLWDKDAVLFPEKINGRYAMLHRLEPDIQIVYFDSFEELRSEEFWREYIRDIGKYVVMKPEEGWEAGKIGAGAPPIKTPHGWLLVYHGVERTEEGVVYRAGAALLDLEDPAKVIARLGEPLFSAELEWEKDGETPNVVFPTAALADGDTLEIYYGCSDSRIGIAGTSLSELVEKLLENQEEKG